MLVIVGIIFLSVWQLSGSGKLLIRGVVTGEDMPIANAVVRVQGEAVYALTDAQGHFSLPVRRTSTSIHITAWAPGYYIAVTASKMLDDVQLVMRRHPTSDNPSYTFISPILEPDHPTACGRCHSAHGKTPNSSLPVDEWMKDAHANAAINPRFLSVYNGTTLDGEKGIIHRLSL